MNLNPTARNTAIGLFASTYASATLQFLNGSTVLASHTLTGFGSPAAGVVTANAIANSTVGTGGTINGAKLIAGSNELSLSVGLTGAEVNVASMTLVQGGNSIVSNLTMTLPASS
jgi:hypothetical protein